MSIFVEAKCDNCGTGLSDSGMIPDYRLVLSAERIPTTSTEIKTVHVIPPILEDHHFCGIHCLKQWLQRNH